MATSSFEAQQLQVGVGGNPFQNIFRDISLLKDENRSVRRKSLEKIKQVAFENEFDEENVELQSFVSQLYKPLLNVLSDPVERCRELSAEVLLNFILQTERSDPFLSYLVPVFVGRLGLPDILEPSEEIRFLLVQILNAVIQRSTREELNSYLSDIVIILVRTIGDPYHRVKEESCHCVVHLSLAIPDSFHLQAESLITPLIHILSHQHSKVRCASVRAIGITVERGNNNSVNAVVSHLSQRLFDHSSSVRLAVAKVIGQWLSELKERATHFHKILPLHLTLLGDEVEEIREYSWNLWLMAGEKYQSENEDRIKDTIDFPKPPPDHYPSGVSRPSFGCRYLVQRHLHQILPAVLNDMKDWVDRTRVQALILLYQLILHAEEKASRYLQLIITSLATAAQDEEKDVVDLAERCSELLGYFVRPDIWCETFLPIVKESPDSGNLLVLSGMLRKSNKTEMVEFVEKVAKCLAQPEICYTNSSLQQYKLVECVQGLLFTCGDLCQQSSFQIFFILISIDSLASENDQIIKEKIESSLQELKKISCQEGKKSLYKVHTKGILQILNREENTLWEMFSPQKMIFSTLINKGDSSLLDNLNIIVPIFVINLQATKPAQFKLQFFTLLSSLLLQAEENHQSKFKLSSYLPIIFCDILLPNFVWHAGLTAEALRTAAVTSLWALCKGCDLTVDLLMPFSDQLLSKLMSLLEDDSQLTRLMTCRVLSLIFPTLSHSVESKQLSLLLSSLFQRIEDVSDDVRIAVTETMEVFFASYPNGYRVEGNKETLQNIFRGLLIHMDDIQPKIQQTVQDLLKSIGLLAPDLLLSEVANIRSKHREEERCDDLILHFKKMNI